MFVRIQFAFILALCALALAAPAPEPSSGQSSKGPGHQRKAFDPRMEENAGYRRYTDSLLYSY